MASGYPPWYREFSGNLFLKIKIFFDILKEIAAVMFHIASSNEIPQIPSFLSPGLYLFT